MPKLEESSPSWFPRSKKPLLVPLSRKHLVTAICISEFLFGLRKPSNVNSCASELTASLPLGYSVALVRGETIRRDSNMEASKA